MGRQSRKKRASQRALSNQLSPPPITTIGGGATANAPGTTISFSSQLSAYSGPTPPPQLLYAYEQIEPGRAAKLMQLAEDQSRHRMSLENRVVDSDIQRSRDGLRNATVLASGGLVGGIALAFFGHDTAGTAIVGTVLGGGLLTFIVGKGMQWAERSGKREKTSPKKKR